MIAGRPGRAAADAGRAVITALLDSGVQHVALSPGSRSGPLALAAAAAERAGRVSLHVRIDERSGAFVALGAAKATGLPAAVICTSGTAAANLLPAIVEARYSGTSLVVLTADRPPELRGRGASQTIDQVGMFDRFVLRSVDLPVPGEPGGGADDWGDAVRASVAGAVRMRGPVHLNLPFRPPLVDADSAGEPWLPAAGGAKTAGAASSSGSAADLLPAVERGVVIAGDLDLWDTATRSAVTGIAAVLGWPIVAEASANLAAAPTTIAHGSVLLGDPGFREQHRAAFALTVGPFGLDRGVLEYVRSADRHVAVQVRPRTDPPDPLGTAERVLVGVPAPTETRGTGSQRGAWLASWRAASERIAALREPDPAPGVGDVAAAAWSALRAEDLLFVAPSLAIRELAARASGSGPRVLANRGANGIDGLISTAVGAAAADGSRTVALLGDLASLHDHNGLLLPTSELQPDLTLVVADNNGAGIFATLEQGAEAFAADFDRVFGTPHDRSLSDVLTAAGVPATRVVSSSDLVAALHAPGTGIRAVVVATIAGAVERERRRTRNEWVRARLADPATPAGPDPSSPNGGSSPDTVGTRS